MSDDDKTEGEGFVIKDSRSSQLSQEEAENQDSQKNSNPAGAETGKQPQEHFQIDFSTFIMSLTSSAFYNFGDIADPETGKMETNLPAVHQTIDMLTMLKEKTTGNLNEEEKKLLEQLIYELQMKYVAKTKSAGSPGK